MLQPSNILNKKFEKSAIGGYKVEDVDTFFSQVADEYQRLCEENEILQQKIEVLANKVEEYRNDENSLRGVLIEAKKLGDSIVAKSKDQAEAIVKEANVRAENASANIRARIGRSQNELLRLQREVGNFKSKITNLYKSHLDMIMSLPDSQEESGVELEFEERSEKQSNWTDSVSKPHVVGSEFKMAQPDENEPVTKQINLSRSFKTEKGSISEHHTISVEENEHGDVISKFGVLKFGESHSLGTEEKHTQKKNRFFKK